MTPPSLKHHQDSTANNTISGHLQQVLKEHKLSTIRTVERRGEDLVFKEHKFFSFEENNILRVNQGGFNLDRMYKYNIVLVTIKKRDSPHLELYF